MDTNNKKMITIENSDGSKTEAELVTFLFSDDQISNYVVYSKGEKTGLEDDEVIYISKIVKKGDVLVISEIEDNVEWSNVQTLLKKIANA